MQCTQYDYIHNFLVAALLRHPADTPVAWLMPDWARLLTPYGSHRGWGNTQPDFEVAVARLQAVQAPPEVMAMCAALRAQGLALEHESVWLSPNESSTH